MECVPPSDLVVNVDSNLGADRWIRLTINVRRRRKRGPRPLCLLLLRLPAGCSSSSQAEHRLTCIIFNVERLRTQAVGLIAIAQKAGGPAPVKQVQLRGSDSNGYWENLNNLWGVRPAVT